MDLFSEALERKTLASLVDMAQLEGPDQARVALEQHRFTSSVFHLPAHRALFGAVATVLGAGQVPDATALASRLSGDRDVGTAGGATWVASLLLGEAGALPGTLATCAAELTDLAQRRRLALLGKRLAEVAHEAQTSPDLAAGKAIAELAKLTNPHSNVRTLREWVEEALDELDKVARGEMVLSIPTGVELLDAKIGGLKLDELHVIGALPGVGKSALIATCVRNLAARGKRVFVCSLEDRGSWLAYRTLADESGVPVFVMRTARLTQKQQGDLATGAEKVWRYGENVFIDDRKRLTAQEIVATARDAILVRGAEVVVVDHLGEIKASSQRERKDIEIDESLSDLRALATTHRVPMLVACHLRRDAEGRDIKLTDFANAAAIERQARVALGLSREHGSGRLLITVLKQTNGQAGARIALEFHGPAAMVKSTGGEEVNG